MTELKRCPFCGSNRLHKDYMGDGETRAFYIICDVCSAFGPEAKNLKLAIDAWNKRSPYDNTYKRAD